MSYSGCFSRRPDIFHQSFQRLFTNALATHFENIVVALFVRALYCDFDNDNENDNYDDNDDDDECDECDK